MQVFTGMVMSCLDTLTSTMVGVQLLIDLKLRYLEDNVIQSQLLNLKGEWNLCPLLLLYPAVVKPDHYIGPSWAFFLRLVVRFSIFSHLYSSAWRQKKQILFLLLVSSVTVLPQSQFHWICLETCVWRKWWLGKLVLYKTALVERESSKGMHWGRLNKS